MNYTTWHPALRLLKRHHTLVNVLGYDENGEPFNFTGGTAQVRGFVLMTDDVVRVRVWS